MAKRVFQANSYTPTALADTTAATNATYQAIGAGSGTQRLNVAEIYLGGQNTASAVNIMVFARESTLGVIPTALAAPNSDGPMDGATAALALPPVSYVAAGTGPKRDTAATSARLNLSFNSFGGIVRWVAYPGEEWVITGTTVSVSESLLSSNTGTAGVMGSHIVYEPF